MPDVELSRPPGQNCEYGIHGNSPQRRKVECRTPFGLSEHGLCDVAYHWKPARSLARNVTDVASALLANQGSYAVENSASNSRLAVFVDQTKASVDGLLAGEVRAKVRFGSV